MESDYSCTECNRSIKNPLCSICRTKQLAMSLNGSTSPNVLSHFIRDIRSKLSSHDSHGDVMCIVCGQNMVSSCGACYFLKIRNVIYFHFPQGFADKIIGNVAKMRE